MPKGSTMKNMQKIIQKLGLHKNYIKINRQYKSQKIHGNRQIMYYQH